MPPQAGTVWALISDIPNAYASGFTLTGNLVVDASLGGSDENPVINFVPLFDRTQPFSDLTLDQEPRGQFYPGPGRGDLHRDGAQYRCRAHDRHGHGRGQFPSRADPDGGRRYRLDLQHLNQLGHLHAQRRPGSSSQLPADHPHGQCGLHRSSVVVNTAAVTGGNDGNSANNTVTDPTTIIRGPDLTIAKTANGSFTQGQSGAGYTLTVTNTGGVATSGTVTVIDNLPTGLSPAAISGPGWSCGISGNTATCTRSDPLAPGASYPPITLTVNVASNAPPSVTNVATVGGGGDLNAANNTATVVTPIARAPDLTITKSHTGNFTQGQTATYTITVTNIRRGPDQRHGRRDRPHAGPADSENRQRFRLDLRYSY